MPLHIRPWQASDIDAIAHIMASHPLWQRYGITEESARTRLQRLMASGEDGFVAEDGTVRGFVLFNTKTFGEQGYIRLLGVNPQDTSTGVGAQLLSRVESFLIHQGINRLLLLCAHWNEGAQRFYMRHGYRLVGRLPNWVLDGTDELIYAKCLSPDGGTSFQTRG